MLAWTMCRFELGVADLAFGPEKEHHQRFLHRQLGETEFLTNVVYWADIPLKATLSKLGQCTLDPNFAIGFIKVDPPTPMAVGRF